ncbi:MAG: hypothetical protein AAGB14_15885, partial [Verrucomicrobiota bacterium]
KIASAQVSAFPGTDPEEYPALIARLREMGLKVHLVIMVGGVDPMDPKDEDATVAQLLPTITMAKEQGIEHLASTSIEQWMQEGAKPKKGKEYDQALAQVVKVHARAFREAGLADSKVQAWHVEFLRPVEFQTFTTLKHLWQFITAVNAEIGQPFFKCLVDAAHCGDSGVDLPTNVDLLRGIVSGDGLGIMHASALTTRGCLSTDDGWVKGMISAAAQTGHLKQVFVEMFHHEDDALAGLREAVEGHGVDTRDGRDYTQVVADGVEEMARVLNNLGSRGFLPES